MHLFGTGSNSQVLLPTDIYMFVYDWYLSQKINKHDNFCFNEYSAKAKIC